MSKSKIQLLKELISEKGWRVCPNWNGNPLQVNNEGFGTVYDNDEEIIFKFSNLVGRKFVFYPNRNHRSEVEKIAEIIGADMGKNIQYEHEEHLRRYNPMGPELGGSGLSENIMIGAAIFLLITFIISFAIK